MESWALENHQSRGGHGLYAELLCAWHHRLRGQDRMVSLEKLLLNTSVQTCIICIYDYICMYNILYTRTHTVWYCLYIYIYIIYICMFIHMLLLLILRRCTSIADVQIILSNLSGLCCQSDSPGGSPVHMVGRTIAPPGFSWTEKSHVVICMECGKPPYIYIYHKFMIIKIT